MKDDGFSLVLIGLGIVFFAVMGEFFNAFWLFFHGNRSEAIIVFFIGSMGVMATFGWLKILGLK